MERWDDVQRAVVSVQGQTVLPTDIVLVSDYNETLLEAAREAFPGISVVANTQSKGLSGARNTGVEYASGDLIAFLDDDAWAEPTWLEHLVAPFADASVAGVGGWITPEYDGAAPAWFPESFQWVVGCSYEGLPESGATIRNPIGASMALRRSVFTTVGGFSAGLGRVGRTPLGCEETELCIRYHQAVPTDRVVLVRDSVVHHRVPAARVTWSYFTRRCWAEGLSKAAVARLTGTSDGLSSERSHLTKTLPMAMVRGLRHTLRRPAAGLQEFLAVPVGAMVAAAGFLYGRFRLRGDVSHEAMSDWAAISIVRFEADQPLNAIVVGTPRAWVQIGRDGQLVGREVTELVDGVLTVAQQEALRDRFSFVRVEPIDDEGIEWPWITVVVPTLARRSNELVAAVERLLALDYPSFDIVVVDNRPANSLDGLPPFLMSDRVTTRRCTIPGVSAARNVGFAAARGEIVACTDDDVQVDPQWLRSIARRFVRNPEVVGVGGMVQPAELQNPAQLWFEEYFGGFSQHYELDITSLTLETTDPLFPYAPGRFWAGCNMAFRVSALAAVGGNIISLGTGTPAQGGEDLEIAMTLAARGYTLAFEPRALVHHTHRRTTAELEQQVFNYGVGLTASYTQLVLAEPRHLGRILRRLPLARTRLTTARSLRLPTQAPTYPKSLTWIERRGMLWGPWSYLRSYWRYRSLPTTPAPFDGHRDRGQLRDERP